MRSRLHTEGFTSPVRVDEALGTFLGALRAGSLECASVKLERSLGRILGDDVIAKVYRPPMDCSIFDGYALRSEDTSNASKANPVWLKILGESKIGERCRFKVSTGKAVAVATGSSIPEGADAAVMMEHVRSLTGGKIQLASPVARWEGISRRGEDVRPGTLILSKGHMIRPQDLGILKAVGSRSVKVVRRPKIGVLSTGNELVDLYDGEKEKSVDVNRPIICGMLRELGAEPIDLGIVRDRRRDILRKLRFGLKAADGLVITAGSSVGGKDLVPGCVNALGKPGMIVHGVAMRPSLPTGIGIVHGKPVLSLPGFPVSAMVAFLVFVKPLISRMLGTTEELARKVDATLIASVKGTEGYRTFVRVKVKRTREGFVAEPLKIQRSSLLMTMVQANGIVVVPEEVSRLEAGARVEVLLLGAVPEVK